MPGPASAAVPSHEHNARPSASNHRRNPRHLDGRAGAREILDELRQKVWTRYSCQLQELLAEQQSYLNLDSGDAGSCNTDF